jgi:DNA-binding transcriptional regulator YdaS (Cro superfamily)
MKLIDYLKKHGQGNRLASDIGVNSVLVSQWKTGVRPIPIERCPDIERATEGAVTRRDLRPDDWHRIWPELVDVDHPAPTEKAAA